jgi:hypothetical protein
MPIAANNINVIRFGYFTDSLSIVSGFLLRTIRIKSHAVSFGEDIITDKGAFYNPQNV